MGRFKFAVFILFVVLAAMWVSAESTDCSTPVIIITDGRITQSTFGQTATYWYGIYAQAAHSYAVEFEPPADNYYNTTKVQIATLGVFGPNDAIPACHGTSTVAVTQNSGYAPVIFKNGNGAGRRISFTAQTAGLHLIAATNLAGPGSYTFRAVDTTLINARWSTWSGYDDQWGFVNLSDMPITGILTVYDSSGQVLAAAQFVVPVVGEAYRSSSRSDLNLPRNTGGSAVFSHNGPPNSVLADAYMISPTGSVVTYTKFQGITGQ